MPRPSPPCAPRGSIETDVAKLIHEMDSSITEADAFIKTLHAE